MTARRARTRDCDAVTRSEEHSTKARDEERVEPPVLSVDVKQRGGGGRGGCARGETDGEDGVQREADETGCDGGATSRGWSGGEEESEEGPIEE